MNQRMKKAFAILLVVCAICTQFPVDAFASQPLSVTWLSQKYDEVFPFADGMAGVHKNGKIIFIDKTGREISPAFSGVAFNKYGYVQVTQDYNKWGLMNNKGKMLAPMIYDGISDLSDGLIRLSKDGKYGYMDEAGEIVIPLKYDAALDFTAGLAPVGTKVKNGYAGDKWGFIDKTGKLVMPMKYTFARNFSEGLAWVAEGDGYNFKYGAIDKTGKVVIPFQFNSVNDFTNGAAYVLKWGNYDYIDKTGKYIPSDKQYKLSHEYKDGLAKVLKYGGDYTYIDESGKAIYPGAPHMGDFSDGLAAVPQGLKHGFIDKTGKVAITFIYDDVCDFSEGLALVRMGEKYLFIDTTGNTAIPLDYARAESYNEGVAKVRTGMHYGLIDKTGKEIVPLIYQNIGSFKDGYAVVTNDNFRDGIINNKGEVVVPLIYDKITEFSEGVAYVTLGDKTGIILSPSSYIYDLPKQAQAMPCTSKIVVNGKDIAIDAYTINGLNYFKLRDLAYVLNGTEKQFNILWDNNKKAINLATNSPYSIAGGEMTKGDGKGKTAVLGASYIYKNDSRTTIAAYSINGSSYFELDKLGEIVDFAVAKDERANIINIDISKGYIKQ